MFCVNFLLVGNVPVEWLLISVGSVRFSDCPGGKERFRMLNFYARETRFPGVDRSRGRDALGAFLKSGFIRVVLFFNMFIIIEL